VHFVSTKGLISVSLTYRVEPRYFRHAGRIWEGRIIRGEDQWGGEVVCWGKLTGGFRSSGCGGSLAEETSWVKRERSENEPRA